MAPTERRAAASISLASLTSAAAAAVLLVSAPSRAFGDIRGYCNAAADYQPAQTVGDAQCRYAGTRGGGPAETDIVLFRSECSAAGGLSLIGFNTGITQCRFPDTLGNQDALCQGFTLSVLHGQTCEEILGTMTAAECVSVAATFDLNTTCCQGSGFTCPTYSPTPVPSPSPTTAYPSVAPSSSAPTPSAAPTAARLDALSDKSASASLTTPIITVCVTSAILLALVAIFKYKMHANEQEKQRNRTAAVPGAEQLLGGGTKPGRSISTRFQPSKQSDTKPTLVEAEKPDPFGADMAALVTQGSFSESVVARPCAYGLIDEFAGDRPNGIPSLMSDVSDGGSPDFDPFAELAAPATPHADRQPPTMLPTLTTPVTPAAPLGGLVFTAPPRVGEHHLPGVRGLRSISRLSLSESGNSSQVYPFDAAAGELKLEDLGEARRGSTFSFDGSDNDEGPARPASVLGVRAVVGQVSSTESAV